MELVDEQNDLPVRFLHFTQHCLQAVFEFTAILRACQHGRQVERDELAILQRRRNITRNDALGQSFDDSCFTGARLTNEHRVVLRTTRQHLDGSTNLFVTTDHGIQFAFARRFGEVVAILVQHLEFCF